MNTLAQEPVSNARANLRNGDKTNYRAWIAITPKQTMVLETVDLGPFGAEDVEIAVEHCGYVTAVYVTPTFPS